VETQDFLERLRNYLSERYGLEYEFVEEYMLKTYDSMGGKGLKWVINAGFSFLDFPHIEEDVSGEIYLESPVTYDTEAWMDATYLRKAKSHEIRERIHELYEAQEKLRDRNNWPQLNKFGYLVARMAWADDIAKRVTEETGVKLIHQIPKPADRYTFFYTSFNGTNLSDERRTGEITKCLNALDRALYYYIDESAYSKFERKFFKATFGKKDKGPRAELLMYYPHEIKRFREWAMRHLGHESEDRANMEAMTRL